MNWFENYFCKLNHKKGTRGNTASLVVLQIQTEAARKTFYYKGLQMQNKPPTKLKKLKLNFELQDKPQSFNVLSYMCKCLTFCKDLIVYAF